MRRRVAKVYAVYWAVVLVIAVTALLLFDWIAALLLIAGASTLSWVAFVVWMQTASFKRQHEKEFGRPDPLKTARTYLRLGILSVILIEGFAVLLAAIAASMWLVAGMVVYGPLVGLWALRKRSVLLREASARG